MRLIDANNISFYCNYEGDCAGGIDDCKKCENYICNFRYIQKQPTAYDVGKVVEELEEAKHEICLSDEDLEHYQNGIDNAIEIVKQGGVRNKVVK